MSAQAGPCKRIPCKWGCGDQVDTFVDDYGLRNYLNVHQPSAQLDLTRPEYRYKVWEYRGHRIGWCLQNLTPRRTWREIRLKHECEHMPKGKR